MSEIATAIDFSFDEVMLHLQEELWKRCGLYIPRLMLRETFFGIRYVDNILFGSYIWGPCCLCPGAKRGDPEDAGLEPADDVWPMQFLITALNV